MAVTLNIYDKGQSAPISTLTSTLAWIGVSSAGNTPGTIQSVYQFSAPGLIPTYVNYGPGPEAVAAAVRVSQTTQVFVRIAGSISGASDGPVDLTRLRIMVPILDAVAGPGAVNYVSAALGREQVEEM